VNSRGGRPVGEELKGFHVTVVFRDYMGDG
jgi:hypothetical protein